MEKSSRRDLIETIEHQREKLQRYEVRLRDIIQAYKSLQNEKKALESSFSALAESTNAASTSSHDEKSADSITSYTDEPVTSSDPLGSIQLEVGNSSPTEDLRRQLAAVTASLKTLMEEKSKMESVFLSDKKKLANEKSIINDQLEEERKKFEEYKKQTEQQIQDLKAKIRDQQREREKDLQDHAVMLRELQRTLAEERANREKLENQLYEAKKGIDEANASKQWEEQEKIVNDLCNQLEKLRKRLKDSEAKKDAPSPLLLELQREMAEMKVQHQMAVQQEQKRADEAETKLRALAAVSEERVASLESHLSELSEMVGNYDRLRNQDQISIQKLKERLTQLDLENAALAHAVGEDKVASSLSADDSNLDVHTLMERILKLKSLLKAANQRSEHPVDLSTFFSSMSDDDSHAKCQEELNQLKEEFERYKLRAQSVLKGKTVKDDGVAKELEVLREQVTDLKEKLQLTKLQLENAEKLGKMAEAQYTSTIQRLKDEHKQELSSVESMYKTRCNEMEQQILKQRERTFALLEEKEQEIELLKGLSSPLLLDSVPTKDHIPSESSALQMSETSLDDEMIKPSISEIDKLTQMLSSKSGKWKTQILYYAQELARKDVDITTLRQSKHQVESALRELQQVASLKEESYVDEIDSLRARIQRLECSQSEKGLNMEYLKNVVLQYMLCRDNSGRRHMLNAIATVLHFTHKELEKVRHVIH